MDYGRHFCRFLGGFKSFSVILGVFVGRYASTWFVVDRCGSYIWLLWIDVVPFGWFRVIVTTLFTCNKFKCLHDEDNQRNVTF